MQSQMLLLESDKLTYLTEKSILDVVEFTVLEVRGFTALNGFF